MAKKSSGGGKSVDIVDLFSYIALVFAGVIFLINAILQLIGGDLGRVMTIMTLIKDISVALALSLGAYNFARRRNIVIKVFFYIAIITYIVCMVFVGVKMF